MSPRIYYRYFVTRKLHFTRRRFVEWQRGGILNEWGAVLVSKGGAMFIPVYLLTKESCALLPPIPGEDAISDKEAGLL